MPDTLPDIKPMRHECFNALKLLNSLILNKINIDKKALTCNNSVLFMHSAKHILVWPDFLNQLYKN